MADSVLRRSALLLGEEAIARLKGASVCVIGLGGVGSYAVEALARAGIGRFTLIDFDIVGETNLNRQLFALRETIGLFLPLFGENTGRHCYRTLLLFLVAFGGDHDCRQRGPKQAVPGLG